MSKNHHKVFNDTVELIDAHLNTNSHFTALLDIDLKPSENMTKFVDALHGTLNKKHHFVIQIQPINANPKADREFKLFVVVLALGHGNVRKINDLWDMKQKGR